MLVSIVIRTLNEGVHLGSLLGSIQSQETMDISWEVVLVDSGSTDDTLPIAESFDCKIIHITREEFSFGRSLNLGCETADGEILVIISGHCVPTDSGWLQALCQPIIDETAAYSYGRQIGGDESQYSEKRVFAKYYPEKSKSVQDGFFCNNANSALSKGAWENYRFDEELTGLEDMELSQRLVNDGGAVSYAAKACVFHHHNEAWHKIELRFEREAIALQKIMPQVHIRFRDLTRYIISSIWRDWRAALREEVFISNAWSIVLYRICQYWGSYKGNHDHRKLSHVQKEEYFFPH